MNYVVGLTGGIGSGKTVVSDHFAYLGVPIIDTDVIAREVVAPGQATLGQLTDEFGTDILLETGELNRAKLRKLAFSSGAQKAKLDAITHPAIRAASLQQIKHAKYAYCIVVVPLLDYHSEFNEMMDRVLAVNADRETRIKRVQKRSGLARDAVIRIMDTQLTDEQRAAFADDIIVNDGSIRDAQQEVERLHQVYLNQSTRFTQSQD